MLAAAVNTTADTTIRAEFSTGDSTVFSLGGVSRDGTASSNGTISFGQSGVIVLVPPPNWRPQTENSDNRYWVRLSWNRDFLTTTPDASVSIDDIDIWTGNPTHIIIIEDTDTGAAVDVWKDTFAFIGPSRGSQASPPVDNVEVGTLNVFSDYGLTKPGWHGKPTIVTNDATFSWTIYNITRAVTTGVIANATGTVNIRESLVQPSFSLAARFTAEDGGRFNTNYMGNKVNRATFNFEENRPATFSFDFTAQDMRHDLGAATSVIKYDGSTATPLFRRVNEQPYFFSRADLRFSGTAFARFRRLALIIDNQLDPRYYTTQSTYVDHRQILYEILEGRRRITLTGTVDLDDTVTDAQFLRWLLNQGFTDADVRNMTTLQGITLVVELERLITAGASPTFDRMTFTLPSGTLGTNNVGLIFNTARHPIPAPPDVHHSIDLDIVASSIQVEVADGVA